MKGFGKIMAAVLFLPAFICCRNESYQPVEVRNMLVNAALYDTTSSYYAGFDEYPSNLSDLPIGIFDLNMGGMAALEDIITLDKFDNITGSAESDLIRDFAGEHFIYYNALSNADSVSDANGMIDIREAAIKNTLFLVGDKCAQGEKERAKIIIASGNITRATGLDDIRQMLELSGTGVKIVGVVEEGVKGLLGRMKEQHISHFSVGLLAEESTIESGVYPAMLGELSAEAGITGTIPFVSKTVGAADSTDVRMLDEAFISMIEEHYASGNNTPISAVIVENSLTDDVEALFSGIIRSYRSKRIRGTYPYRNVIMEDVLFIDPTEYAAIECYRTLRTDGNLALRITDQQVVHYTDLPYDI